MKDVLDLSWNIAQAVSIPVMADFDTVAAMPSTRPGSPSVSSSWGSPE